VRRAQFARGRAGLAKTLMVKTLARIFDWSFSAFNSRRI